MSKDKELIEKIFANQINENDCNLEETLQLYIESQIEDFDDDDFLELVETRLDNQRYPYPFAKQIIELMVYKYEDEVKEEMEDNGVRVSDLDEDGDLFEFFCNKHFKTLEDIYLFADKLEPHIRQDFLELF
jgi:hypothetical protein